MMFRVAIGVAAFVFTIPVPAAEPEINRFDLGLRLVLLEKAWDAQSDPAIRKRALPTLKLAVPQMLSGKVVEAASTLDSARLMLRGGSEPTAAVRWAESLLVHPACRLIDPADGRLAVGVLAGYPAGDVPLGVTLRAALIAADGSTPNAVVESPVSKLPVPLIIPIGKLPEGDHALRVEVVVGGQVLATHTAGVSVAPRLSERLDALWMAAGKTDYRSTETATLGSRAGLLAAMARRQYSPETNYPAARMLAEGEALVKSIAANQPFYGPKRTGQFWLTIPGENGQSHMRLFVPEEAKSGKPLPLVVALHGAGGSENLFFDAYGYGLIARLAKERGWMVVAPRAGWLFDGPPPVAAIVDELAKLYRIDPKRVFMVGHSMGAMQTITIAQQSPGRFAALAALGGGGAVNKPEAFKSLPVFVGCGVEDFALGGAKGLTAALKKADAANVTFKEYAGVEHILVVQEALPEVFKFFEKAKPN
jgi:predicted esterase